MTTAITPMAPEERFITSTPTQNLYLSSPRDWSTPGKGVLTDCKKSLLEPIEAFENPRLMILVHAVYY